MKENDTYKKYSQQLRKNATKEERLLWNAFLKKYQVQFRRQCVLGSYIVDFYCAKARLVIELDGSQHYEPMSRSLDRERSAYLKSLGLEVLRFSNLDVIQRFDGVCQAIDMAVKKRYVDGATPVGVGRRAMATEYFARVQSPHPPPAGAPSPQGEGVTKGGTMNLRSLPSLVWRALPVMSCAG